MAPLDSIYTSLTELLDFSIKPDELKGQYNQDILQKREDFLHIYKKSAMAADNVLKINNVRDYMGYNRVNKDILGTLKNKNSSDFWLLNNGITMLVNDQLPLGETVTLRNIQIVNGLQTTLTIFDFFSAGGSDPKDRCILIKIIKTDDKEIRDSVIIATNNQTDVSISALHATDKIQRDIEEILLKHGLYYERKIKYYENQGCGAI